MRLLIDGYNLLHATDLFGAGALEGTLRGSREALVAFLAERLTAAERQSTVVVFDASDAPPGLPDRYQHEGIDLRFARSHRDADEMIEAILEGVHRAKHLTVVSGDRRVQRAARSSGARWVSSSEWFADLCRRSPAGEAEAADALAEGRRIAGPAASAAHWVAEFSDPAKLAEIARQAEESALPRSATRSSAAPGPSPPLVEKPPTVKKGRRRPPLAESAEKPRGEFGAGVFDPFPPGYADDLLSPAEKARERGPSE